MKLVLTTTLLLFSVFFTLSQNTVQYEVDSWVKKAENSIYKNPYKALVFIDSAKIISKSAGFYDKLANIYDLESDILKAINKNGQAKYASYEGLLIAQKLKDSSLIHKFKVKIARHNTLSGSYEKAQISLNQAIKFGERNKKYCLLGDAYNAKGQLFLYENKYEFAQIAYMQAQDYYTKAKDTFRSTKLNINLGITAFRLNKFTESKAFFVTALNQSIQSEDIGAMQSNLANLGEYFLELKMLDSAYLYVKQAYDVCKKNDLKAASINVLNLMVTIFEQKENQPQALYYQKELTQVQNEVLNNELNLASRELDRLFKTADSVDKIDYVRGLLQDVERKNASLIRLLIVCGIFFILIILIIYFAYRQQNNLNRALLEQRTAIFHKNELIDVALKEKEILLKEIHHRVKNNLQIISSLLNLQSRTITDEKALRALSEGRTRIQAIALLHQKLYQNETFSTVSLEDYLVDLSTNLRHSLTSAAKVIDIKVKAKDIIINLDTAVPLGLIITELVTNSLKHAFTEKEEGTIIIEVHKITDSQYILEIHDNGKGLPEGFTIPMEGSLGTEIVEALTEQLEGVLTFERNNPGAYFKLHFEEVSVD